MIRVYGRVSFSNSLSDGSYSFHLFIWVGAFITILLQHVIIFCNCSLVSLCIFLMGNGVSFILICSLQNLWICYLFRGCLLDFHAWLEKILSLYLITINACILRELLWLFIDRLLRFLAQTFMASTSYVIANCYYQILCGFVIIIQFHIWCIIFVFVFASNIVGETILHASTNNEDVLGRCD